MRRHGTEGFNTTNLVSGPFSEFFTPIFSHFPEGLLTVCRGVVIFANNAFFNLSGLNTSNVIGATLQDVLERISASPKVIDKLTALNTSDLSVEGVCDLSVEGVCDGGRRRIFRIQRFRIDDPTLFPSHDNKDHAELDAVMFIDDTIWRETQRASEVLMQQLLRADRHAALGEMAMALAHEINQPLGAIVNFAGAARHTLKSRAIRVNELDEVLQNIGAEAARAGDVIKSLRSFLRGKPLTAHSADVNAAVKVVLGFSEPAMREYSITTQLALASALPPVQADQIILQQIVLNLVTNAIQAVQDQPEPLRQLFITTGIKDGNLITIEVRDTGCGLPQDLTETIFEPFVTTKENGSGLGLSIARTLAQRLGGSIEAFPAKDRGACFIIRLPCRSIEMLPHA